MSQLQETNQTLDFFCDFDKISANVAEVEMSLNTLNYLIGKEDLAKGVAEIWQRDPKVFEVLGILIAVRDEGRKPVVDSQGNVVLLKSYFESETKVVEFLQGTGLADIFESRREEIEDSKTFATYRRKIPDIVKAEDTQTDCFDCHEAQPIESLPFLED